MTPADFESRYIVRYRHVLRLRRPADSRKHCVFLTADGCSIHEVKPTQCRTYPFWPSLIQSREMWKEEGKFCPGIGKGELVQIDDARKIASELAIAYPTLTDF